MKNSSTSGYLILEALLAIVVLGLVIASVFPTINFLLRRSRKGAADTEATLLLQEGIEATYNIFLAQWDAYAPGQYVLAQETNPQNPTRNRWALLLCSSPACDDDDEPLLEAKYRRIIEILPIRRNSDGTLGGSSTDPNSKLIRTTIQWQENTSVQEIQAELLLYNL